MALFLKIERSVFQIGGPRNVLRPREPKQMSLPAAFVTQLASLLKAAMLKKRPAGTLTNGSLIRVARMLPPGPNGPPPEPILISLLVTVKGNPERPDTITFA